MSTGTITLSLPSLLTLIFNNDESLRAARSEIIRTPVYMYAPGRIITPELAEIIFTIDPGEEFTHIQPIPTAIGDVWMLWRKADWLGSEAQRYERALAKAAERRANNTKMAKDARITETARRFAEWMGQPNLLDQYRTTFAKMYYEDSGEQEAEYKDRIERIVNPIFAKREGAPDFYIPLPVDVLQRIEAERAQDQQTISLLLTTTSTTEQTHEHQRADDRDERDEHASPDPDRTGDPEASPQADRPTQDGLGGPDERDEEAGDLD